MIHDVFKYNFRNINLHIILIQFFEIKYKYKKYKITALFRYLFSYKHMYCNFMYVNELHILT